MLIVKLHLKVNKINIKKNKKKTLNCETKKTTFAHQFKSLENLGGKMYCITKFIFGEKQGISKNVIPFAKKLKY